MPFSYSHSCCCLFEIIAQFGRVNMLLSSWALCALPPVLTVALPISETVTQVERDDMLLSLREVDALMREHTGEWSQKRSCSVGGLLDCWAGGAVRALLEGDRTVGLVGHECYLCALL